MPPSPPALQRSPQPTRLVWWGSLVLASVVLLAPLLVVDVPPILDYPNHLARMVVLGAGSGDPVLSRMYSVQWHIIPNLAIDLVVPWLMQMLPVHVAGRIMLGIILLIPSAGVIAYHRALFGQRSLWPVASALIAYNGLFLLGFLNFLVSTGAAFLVAAYWIAGRDRHPRLTSLICSVGTAGVFFCHLSGVLFAAVLTFCHEAERLLRCRQRGERLAPAASASAGLLVIMVLPTVLLYRLSAFDNATGVTNWESPGSKLLGLLQPVLNYNVNLDLVTAILILAFIGLCLRHRQWDMPPSSILALAIFLALYAAAPFAAKGGAWIDARFSLVAALMLFAGGRPGGSSIRPAWPQISRPIGAVVALCCACLLLVRVGFVATVWSEHRAELAELRASIAPVTPGTRVLVVRVSPEADPGFWAVAPRSRYVIGSTTTEIHEAALLLIERKAFWPALFAAPAQQPVVVREPYRAIAIPVGMPPDYHALLTVSADDLLQAPYLADWRDRFDDVLVLDAEGVPDLSRLLPATLQRVNDTGFAALYRINPQDTRSGQLVTQ